MKMGILRKKSLRKYLLFLQKSRFPSAFQIVVGFWKIMKKKSRKKKKRWENGVFLQTLSFVLRGLQLVSPIELGIFPTELLEWEIQKIKGDSQ